MAVKKASDRYSNLASIAVTEASAGVQASAKFAFPFSIMDKMGLLISRIEYWWEGFGALNSSGDRCIAAIATASSLADISKQSDPQMIDSCQLAMSYYGTPATAQLFGQPFIKDFSDLPGGGILVAPNPLYALVQDIGAGSVMGVQIRMWYTYMEMSADEYWQLVESRRIIST